MRRLTPALFVLIALSVAAPAASAQALPDGVTKAGTVEGITEYRLKNGLRILLLPDSSQPKVTVNCTVFVGSRHEGYGETGMAHLLEHMLFKGCPKFPDVPKALRDRGAFFNGTTWVDRTNYYETMPAGDDNLEFGIELEADRLVRSFIKREDLLSEFTVVRNEFESGENDPGRMLSQRMMATAYEWHNYGKSTIGNRADIEKVPVDSLRAFYKKYYRPDNALLIVAGQFDEAKAVAYAARHFGPLTNPADPVPATYTEEPPQDGERVVTLRRVGTVGATGVVYHIPAGPHPDFPACEVLLRSLVSEPSGRVYKALVETKKASSISGSGYAWHDPGVIEITAQTEPAQTEAARDALIATLEKLAEQPITAEEVERAKRELLRSRERTLANSQAFALQTSEWAGAGDWRLFFLHRDRLERVTADDVNRAARTYLIRSNRTVGVYVPTRQPERASVPDTPDVATLVKDYKGKTALAAGEAFDPTPENVEKRVKRGTVGEGVKYALLPKKTRGETVNLTLTLRFGSEESLQGKTAAADFLGPLLNRGTKTKTRQQIKDTLDKLNATGGVMSGLGQLQVGIQTKRANLPAVLGLYAEILREPGFPEKEFDILKRQHVEQLDSRRTEPDALAATALQRKLAPYPKENVRYVPTIEESIERTKAVTLDQVKELYATQLGSAAGELAVVGDFDPEPALAKIDGFLKGWTAKVPYRRIEQTVPGVAGSKQKIETPDKANAVYMAGMMIPLSDKDPEYAAVALGNYLLGEAPLASRLSNRVRGKDGLSYGVMSMAQASSLDKAGVFMTFAITNPKNMDKVDVAIAEEVSKFLAEGVSGAELEEGKRAYLQTLKEQRASDAGLARRLSQSLHAGRTFGYYADLEKRIDALQPGDIKAAFGKLLDPKKLVVVEAGDFAAKDEKKPADGKTGPVKEGKR